MTKQQEVTNWDKSKIKEILDNMPYKFYYESSKYADFRYQLRDEIRNLNCSDKAPHQDEIDTLAALGLSYPQIRKILEKKYYSNIQEISK